VVIISQTPGYAPAVMR